MNLPLSFFLVVVVDVQFASERDCDRVPCQRIPFPLLVLYSTRWGYSELHVLEYLQIVLVPGTTVLVAEQKRHTRLDATNHKSQRKDRRDVVV